MNTKSSTMTYGERYSFLVSLGEQKRIIPYTVAVQQCVTSNTGDWPSIVRGQIADTFGIPQSCQLTILYIDKDGNEVHLYVVLHSVNTHLTAATCQSFIAISRFCVRCVTPKRCSKWASFAW
jgi:hypothetical protein